MSWGNKLVIVFIVFAALMGTLVYNALTTKFELVTKDYYKEELRYQDKIDGAANAEAIGKLKLEQDNATISIILPNALSNSIAVGEAWFYCKTNAKHDVRVPVTIEEGKYVFDKTAFVKDSYQLKLELKDGETKYYFLDQITVD